MVMKQKRKRPQGESTGGMINRVWEEVEEGIDDRRRVSSPNERIKNLVWV